MKIGDNISTNRLSAIFYISIAMLVLLPSCFNDHFNKAIMWEVTLPEIMIPLDSAPIPGNNGIITPIIVNNTSIQIQWTKAEDKETAQSELAYRVYLSEYDNIDTVKLAEENGSPVDGWQKDIATATIGSLTPNTTYYFNVLVRDSAGNKAAYATLPVTTSISPINVPVPGKSGIIITTAVGTTSIQLSWARATDVETPQADLEYSLYRSGSNNIGTPDDAANNGAVVVSWQKDIVTALVDGLSPSTTYYFNVVVRDGDGNRVAYITVAVTTQSDTIYMSSVGPYSGDLSTPTSASVRTDIDTLCGVTAAAAKVAAQPCLNKRAFISISSTDDIAGMPKNFGIPTDKKIVGPTGIQISANWAGLLDGNIDVTLSDAGIASDHWWSGSTSSGIYNSSVDNCTGWTSTGSKGQAGKSNMTDASWMEGEVPSCNASRYVLCVCW